VLQGTCDWNIDQRLEVSRRRYRRSTKLLMSNVRIESSGQVTWCAVNDWKVHQHMAYYRPGLTHPSTSIQQYHHPRNHGEAGSIFMTVGKFSAHGSHACEIGCQDRIAQPSAHISCKKLCVWMGGHVRVSPVKCIAKYTQPRTNAYGLVALHTKRMFV